MSNSFDMFDTLIAGRNIKIAAGNQLGQFPIAENVAKVKPGDIIVSDYEHPEKVEAHLRALGLNNKAVVTPCGKYDGFVWSTLPFKPETHTGDNHHADVVSPTTYGIKGVQVTQHKLTEAEQKLIDFGFFNLAMCCREARLTTWSQAHRDIQVCQTNYNFPALFLASVLLQRKHPTGALLFSARDCFMWVELMQRMYQRGVYWYTSCHARLNADENYHRYIRSFDKGDGVVLVDLSGSGNSFSKLPQYRSVLMYKPLRTNEANSIPALFQSADAWRLEQCNRAPHRKCMGVDDNLQPVWLDRYCATPITKTIIDQQMYSFKVAMDAMKHYDFTADTHQPESAYKLGLDYLLHRYIKFASAVEPLRLLDIAEDK
jgi:hypothetical protein